MPKSINRWLVIGTRHLEADANAGLHVNHYLCVTREKARKMLRYLKGACPNFEGAIYKITSVEKAR